MKKELTCYATLLKAPLTRRFAPASPTRGEAVPKQKLNDHHLFIFNSPIGTLTLHIVCNKLIKIDFPPSNPLLQNHASDIDIPTQEICHQLKSYFKNPRHLFNLELEYTGTPFQQKVWHALRQIPSGTTLSYNALAKQLKTSPRAIGNACRANPIPIIIPCHRIVAQNDIGGFAGTTTGTLIDIKKWLLQHEAV